MLYVTQHCYVSIIDTPSSAFPTPPLLLLVFPPVTISQPHLPHFSQNRGKTPCLPKRQKSSREKILNPHPSSCSSPCICCKGKYFPTECRFIINHLFSRVAACRQGKAGNSLFHMDRSFSFSECKFSLLLSHPNKQFSLASARKIAVVTHTTENSLSLCWGAGAALMFMCDSSAEW